MPYVWSVLLAVLLLGPALGPGVVLSYDMVWVPHLAMRPDFLGLGSALPRAVPSDAVVAALNVVLPGALLQKIVLLGSLVGAGAGVLRLGPQESLVGRLVCVTVYQWNPLVAERLVLGHWPLLVGYAVLPWVVDAARRWRSGADFPWRLLWLLPLGSLSASTGIVTAAALLVFVVGRPLRRGAVTAVLVLCANAPWWVAGLLHASTATVGAASVRAYALSAEGSVPAPLAALGLGGVWSSEVVPSSHRGVLGWVWLLALAVLVVVGLLAWRDADRLRYVGCWALGYGWAVLTWAAPGLVAVLAGHVPGGGLLRDGSRTLVLCAPLVAVLAGRGAQTLVLALAEPARPGLVLAVLLLPVMLLPDAAFGVGGRLRPTSYPVDWLRARSVVTTGSGDVLVLPLTSYRAPAWNDGEKVFDPMGRLLRGDYLASDRFVVAGVPLPGEDPRVDAAERALRHRGVAARRSALARLGVGWVVVERDAAGPKVPDIGRPVLSTSGVEVLRVPHARVLHPSPARWVALVGAFAAFVGSVLTGLAGGLVGWRRRAS